MAFTTKQTAIRLDTHSSHGDTTCMSSLHCCLSNLHSIQIPLRLNILKMLNRRNFVKHASTAALGSFMFSKQSAAFFNSTLPAPGLQLFTFFDVIDKDVKGTMQKI